MSKQVKSEKTKNGESDGSGFLQSSFNLKNYMILHFSLLTFH